MNTGTLKSNMNTFELNNSNFIPLSVLPRGATNTQVALLLVTRGIALQTTDLIMIHGAKPDSPELMDIVEAYNASVNAFYDTFPKN